MDKKSPISRLMEAGIGFDGSPLPQRNETETSDKVLKAMFEAIRRRKFKARAVVGLAALVVATAGYFWSGCIWIYFE